MSKENTIFSKIKFLIITLIFLLLFGVVAGLLITVGLDNKEKEKNQATNIDKSSQIIDEPEEVVTPLAEEIVTPLPEINETVDSASETFINDTPLQIGTDLPPGIYKLISKEPTAFYRISTTYQANFIDIKDNDVFSRFTYIKVADGDFLTLIDAEAVALENSPSHSVDINSTNQSVKYLVGKDLEPGDYTVIPDDKYGFVEISNSPTRTKSTIISSSYISKPISVSLLEGQYFKVSQSKIMLNH